MEEYANWWAGLGLLLKIYWGIAIPFTVFFLLQLIASFLSGGDAPDHSTDAQMDADHGISFQFLTLKNLIGFFTIFSWTGIACVSGGMGPGLSLLISSISGLLMMGLMGGLFYLMARSGEDGTMKFDKAIGEAGVVYLTIPGNRGGMGKVQVKVTGAERTLDAMTEDQSEIPTGRMIRVSRIDDHILIVTAK